MAAYNMAAWRLRFVLMLGLYKSKGLNESGIRKTLLGPMASNIKYT